MKKLFYSVLVVGLMATGVFAKDMIVQPTALPQNAQAFIQSNFKDVAISYVEQDRNDFEVRLANGVKIDFHLNGEWKEIESYGTAIPAGAMPAPVAQAVQKAYPQAAVFSIEKEWNGYEVKLNTGMKLLVNDKGNIVGQKMDD